MWHIISHADDLKFSIIKKVVLNPLVSAIDAITFPTEKDRV